MHKKNNGSYYTPDFLAEFIMRYVSSYFTGCKRMSILEPSCGDGSFIRAFNKTKFPESIKSFSFQAVEKIKPELRKAQQQANIGRKKNVRFSFVKKDFLKYQETVNRKFALIAGNPPYIKKSFLNKTQINLCTKMHIKSGLDNAAMKNIWPYFLVRSCQLLNDTGVLSMVLPAELLQVNFSIELRKFLVDNFQRTEIFTFDDLLFECKGQDTVLLFAYRKHANAGQFYTHISETKQLETNGFVLTQNAALKSTDSKWTHHLLSSDDLTFIHNVGGKVKKMNDYCSSKPGIVTAANNFFIVNNQVEELYNLSDFVRPIIQKGYFVNGSVVFDKGEYMELVKAGKPAKILCISDADVYNLPALVNEYLEVGVKDNLPKGYKCSKRKNWFVVPNITEAPDGFFFRRVHRYPKLLKNAARVLVTDTAYQIEMRNEYNIEQLIYCFYSSLTLAFAELGGRYYGGGVLELTPNEFKNLPVAHGSIKPDAFRKFRLDFENKLSIEDILKSNDKKILNDMIGLSAEEVEKVQVIYTRLVNKRFRR